VERGNDRRDHGEVGARLVDLVEHLADVEDRGGERKAGESQRNDDTPGKPESHRQGQRNGDGRDHESG
jgi:hypothetical protein